MLWFTCVKVMTSVAGGREEAVKRSPERGDKITPKGETQSAGRHRRRNESDQIQRKEKKMKREEELIAAGGGGRTEPPVHNTFSGVFPAYLSPPSPGPNFCQFTGSNGPC